MTERVVGLGVGTVVSFHLNQGIAVSGNSPELLRPGSRGPVLQVLTVLFRPEMSVRPVEFIMVHILSHVTCHL
jgi:hypothetical protein